MTTTSTIPRKTAQAGENASHQRDIQIPDWKAHVKNTLRGFFIAILPNGMILRNLMLHRKGESRSTADKFRDQILAALDHLGGQR